MNPQDLINAVEDLTLRVQDLEDQVAALSDFSQIPLEMQNALVQLGFLKLSSALGTGLVYSTGGALGVITGASGTYYVATSSGGTVTHPISFTSGPLTTA